jgi:hypothetical protein
MPEETSILESVDSTTRSESTINIKIAKKRLVPRTARNKSIPLRADLGDTHKVVLKRFTRFSTRSSRINSPALQVTIAHADQALLKALSNLQMVNSVDATAHTPTTLASNLLKKSRAMKTLRMPKTKTQCKRPESKTTWDHRDRFYDIYEQQT